MLGSRLFLHHALHEKDIKHLEEIYRTKGKLVSIFHLKDKILESKKIPHEQVVIVDPNSNQPVYSAKEIKRVTLEYCVSLLTNAEPKEKYKDLIKYKEEIHNVRMRETIDDDIEELSYERFSKIFRNMKGKTGNKYKFLTEGGKSLEMALFNLYKEAWKTEDLPRGWQDSNMIQLSKGKSQVDILDNYRFIHNRPDYGKFFTQIVLSYAKEIIFDHMSKFQIACRPGHRPEEHLYVIKSVFYFFKIKKRGLIFSSFDLSKFFDSENAFDVFL